MKNYSITIILFCFLTPLFAQKNQIDSLKNLLTITKTDTAKANILNDLANYYASTKPDTCLYYAQKAFDLSKKSNYALGQIASRFNSVGLYLVNNKQPEALILLDSLKSSCLDLASRNKGENYYKKKLLARIYSTIANCYNILSNYDLAIENYKLSLETSKSINHKKLMASAYLSLGWAYNRMGNYSESIKNNFASLKLAEELNDHFRITSIYNSIGAVYMAQKKWNDALIYLEKASKIAEKENFFSVLVSINYNIATIYITENKPDVALIYAQKAYKFSTEENLANKHGHTLALLVLADSYSGLNNHPLAINKNTEALHIAESLSDSNLIANCYVSMTHKYKCAGDMKQAISYGERGLALCKRIGAQELTSIVTPFLIECYLKINNYKKAYEMKLLETITNDSILSESNQKEILNQQYQYQYQKQAIADSLKYDNDKKIQIIDNQAKFKEEKNKRITLYIFLGLAIAIGAFVFNRFKVTQKQKSLIEAQSQRLEIAHSQLEIKSKEIKDSILYSKEIQNVFLRPLSENAAYFNDSLLVYKPKDVVSGDFYWYKEFNDNLFIVIGDCTGHGVPGAIISVLAIQTLERLIGQLTDASKLHQLNELMNNEFKIYNSKNDLVNIGLDYSIMCLNKKTNMLYLSGSGSSTLIKNNKNELIQEKFDSINIGGDMPFKYEPETKSYNVSDVHALFLYTDGVVDQRGGVEKKRFSSGQLKELITNLNTNNSTIAYQKIEKTLLEWQGENAQIDDMTLFAIQFNNI